MSDVVEVCVIVVGVSVVGAGISAVVPVASVVVV